MKQRLLFGAVVFLVATHLVIAAALAEAAALSS
jgi:hypothetical protein